MGPDLCSQEEDGGGGKGAKFKLPLGPIADVIRTQSELLVDRHARMSDLLVESMELIGSFRALQRPW